MRCEPTCTIISTDDLLQWPFGIWENESRSQHTWIIAKLLMRKKSGDTFAKASSFHAAFPFYAILSLLSPYFLHNSSSVIGYAPHLVGRYRQLSAFVKCAHFRRLTAFVMLDQAIDVCWISDNCRCPESRPEAAISSATGPCCSRWSNCLSFAPLFTLHRIHRIPRQRIEAVHCNILFELHSEKLWRELIIYELQEKADIILLWSRYFSL